jgi:transposase
VVRRPELTEAAWQQIRPLLPPTRRPGGQWADHRRVRNGVVWKLATGVPWRDLPARYGPWQTCYERFRRWTADGTWDRLLAHAQTKSDAAGETGLGDQRRRDHRARPPARRRARKRKGGPHHNQTKRPIKHSDAPAAGGPPGCTWPPTDTVGR